MTVLPPERDRRWDYRRAAVQRVEDAVRKMLIDKAQAAAASLEQTQSLEPYDILATSSRTGDQEMIYAFIPFVIVCAALAQQPAPAVSNPPARSFGRTHRRPRARCFSAKPGRPLPERRTWRHSGPGGQRQPGTEALRLVQQRRAGARQRRAIPAIRRTSGPAFALHPSAVALRDKDNYVDLTGLGKNPLGDQGFGIPPGAIRS